VSALLAAAGDLGIFGKDPIGIVIVKVVAILVLLLTFTLFNIWFERRIVSFMQMRIGPNRVGPQGLLQSLMDALKLLFKEEIIPKAADRPVYILAPIVSAFTAIFALAVIPMGPVVSMFGVETPLQVVDFPSSVLFVMAIASVGIYGIVLAGWSSGSTYALLGGIRSSAQMISYEIPMGLSFVAVFLYAGTASTSQIIASQERIWYVLLLLPSFLIYVTAMIGETNRAPFDLPEAESELVGGFHTEYSSMKFAAFFLAEYINMFTVSAVATTLFLGGWRAPWPISIWDGANQGWFPLIWFLAKIVMFQFMFIWLRGTLPRYRYDQFMRFGWKVLLPASLVWIMVVATARGLRNNMNWDTNSMLTKIGIPVAVLLVVWTIIDELRARRSKPTPAHVAPHDAFAGGHPVPPLPEQAFGSRPIDYVLRETALRESPKKPEVPGA
jgi:NADH-quinone oxidoreductase subunit H